MIGPILRQEIEHTFQVVREKCTSDELVFLCLECGDKSGHRSLNLKSELTFCWRCNKGQNNKGWFLAWARVLGYEFSSVGESNSGILLTRLLEESDRSTKPVVPILKE